MSFTAKLTDTLVLNANNGQFRTFCSPPFLFTRNRVHIPIPEGKYILNPFNESATTIFDKQEYTIEKLAKDHLSYTSNAPYQAKFKYGCTVNLETNWWQSQRLKLTHERTLLQRYKESSISYIATLVSGLLIAFFTAKFIYKSELKEQIRLYDSAVNVGQQYIRDSLKRLAKPITHQKAVAHIDTSRTVDTFHKA